MRLRSRQGAWVIQVKRVVYNSTSSSNHTSNNERHDSNTLKRVVYNCYSSSYNIHSNKRHDRTSLSTGSRIHRHAQGPRRELCVWSLLRQSFDLLPKALTPSEWDRKP